MEMPTTILKKPTTEGIKPNLSDFTIEDFPLSLVPRFSRLKVTPTMNFKNLEIQGLIRVDLKLHGDPRGFFVERYKVSAPYNDQSEGGILRNEPEIGIRWPIDSA